MGLQVQHVSVGDPLLQPLFKELEFEYYSRYGEQSQGELQRFSAEEFTAPRGAFLVLTEGGHAVAGGAFRRYDPETAELKRMWTSSSHRRRGLARRVLDELESAAAALGYRRIYLTTGPRQPEAKALYLATGYSPLFDLTANNETLALLPFEKITAPRSSWTPETPTN